MARRKAANTRGVGRKNRKQKRGKVEISRPEFWNDVSLEKSERSRSAVDAAKPQLSKGAILLITYGNQSAPFTSVRLLGTRCTAHIPAVAMNAVIIRIAEWRTG